MLLLPVIDPEDPALDPEAPDDPVVLPDALEPLVEPLMLPDALEPLVEPLMLPDALEPLVLPDALDPLVDPEADPEEPVAVDTPLATPAAPDDADPEPEPELDPLWTPLAELPEEAPVVPEVEEPAAAPEVLPLPDAEDPDPSPDWFDPHAAASNAGTIRAATREELRKGVVGFTEATSVVGATAQIRLTLSRIRDRWTMGARPFEAASVSRCLRICIGVNARVGKIRRLWRKS
jgi:hypothetical protein